MRLLQHIERRHVSARQIHHVDVVPNSYKIVLKRFKSTKVELTGPVGGAVVSAEDGQNGQVPNRDLRYQRHYISERFDGILAYQSRGMRSQRIEVSQRNNVPLFIGVCDVFEHLLDEIFGLSVNVRDVVAHAVRLCDREEIGLAVDRARAGEDQLEAPELFHYLEEVQHSDQVVLVVKQRVLHGLADGFDRGEVDHAVDFVLQRLHFEEDSTVGILTLAKMFSRAVLSSRSHS